MSQDSNKLYNELKFIEDSLKAGIITEAEYETAKKRIEEKLNLAKEEEIKEEEQGPTQETISTEPEKESVSEEKEELEKKHDNEEKKQEEKHNLKVCHEPSVVEKEPEVKEEEIKPKKTEPKVQFETYEAKKFPKKSTSLIIISTILLLLIIFFSINNIDKPVEGEEEFIPVCETDLECQKTGFVGKCINASTKDADCVFEPAIQVEITVITSEDCALCDTERMLNTLKQIYPGAYYTALDSDDEKAKSLISGLNIESLPAYILEDSVEKTKRFEATKSMLVKLDDIYLVKPTAAGSSYFFNKGQKKNLVELYIDPFASSSQKAFSNLLTLSEKQNIDYSVRYNIRKDIDPQDTETQELFTQICIRDHSSSKFILYLQCSFEKGATKEASSICLELSNVPSEKIEKCVEEKAISLLNKDIEEADGFSINTAPVFIFNNQYKKGGSLSVDLLNDAYCNINPEKC